MSDATARQQQRLMQLRASVMEKWGARPQPEAAAAAGRSGYDNPRDAGLLSMSAGSELVYPGFQFADDEVRAGWLALVLPLLDAGWTDTEILMWFGAPTGWLDGQCPADVLDRDPGAVRRAIMAVKDGSGQ